MQENEKLVLNELRNIQKDKENWKYNIDTVARILNENESANVKAKALWILGEMGLIYSEEIRPHVDEIAGYMKDKHPKLRERSLNALGRIGRADSNLITPYMDGLMMSRHDESDNVRLAFVWACENIATNSPEMFCNKLDIFYEMIGDSSEKVRMEAPEMFRVVGKRKPECVKPYLDRLEWIGENDNHRVVRIHSKGAVRITRNALEEN